jgi:hypothetical protein
MSNVRDLNTAAIILPTNTVIVAFALSSRDVRFMTKNPPTRHRTEYFFWFISVIIKKEYYGGYQNVADNGFQGFANILHFSYKNHYFSCSHDTAPARIHISTPNLANFNGMQTYKTQTKAGILPILFPKAKARRKKRVNSSSDGNLIALPRS